MPTISKFYGIVVFMNYNEHNPPHFHAIYQEQEASIDIQTGLVQGKMSKRVLRMLFEWSEIHKDELMENWELARNRKQLNKIEPLV
ncbi:MAG: DUF4160 domain-containing protein [Candidatus Scalindua sp. AMX11]|nr:MAG: DUF4160 domain-containing protein [Candidatus Scalindua sp.]NOG85681.1 DUF4160 domain-containing protein [Planctomycetota bacterium]RZV82426.1 MAG: DUF4160 domain-containing protein [Candidatus Scalindua sp. SCAELEC01]TDE65652.1 MAG: DUF4160 domain-containing protein [Candidatus Scalindua sp. AMX11]GJQ59150.1 MAG: hypothetical protein SCALA701_19510 [Candidatus Scalindua sp.]